MAYIHVVSIVQFIMSKPPLYSHPHVKRYSRVFVNGDLNHGDLRSIGVIAFIATWEETNLVMEN